MREDITFAVVAADSPDALVAMERYFDELDRRFEQGFDTETALAESVSAYNPPRGVFVVVS